VKARIAALALAVLAACRSGSTSVPEARADEPAGNTSGVAVVELFTSEGCSSCPPADIVLSDLARPSERPAVYALAFHVDYWDDLGWRDPYASPDHSARQQAYARAFGRAGVYTPQMIVGGAEQFTGSDRDRAFAAVARALARPASVRLSLHLQPAGPNAMTVRYEAPGAPAGSVLNMAIVEHDTSTSVRAGENSGKTLHHANVVRTFLTTPLVSPTGSVAVKLPTSLPSNKAELIAYVARPSTDGSGIPVLGATRSPLVAP
jgi:hypothetical protein